MLKPGRAERTASKRQLILDTSQSLFNQYGYLETTINQIISETGLPSGTIYHIFKSKEEIVKQLYMAEFSTPFGLCDDMGQKLIDPIANIQTLLLDASHRWMHVGWGVAAYFFIGYIQHRPRPGQDEGPSLPIIEASPGIDELEQFIAAAQQHGSFDSSLPYSQAAAQIAAAARGLLLDWVHAQGSYNLAENAIPFWERLLSSYSVIP